MAVPPSQATVFSPGSSSDVAQTRTQSAMVALRARVRARAQRLFQDFEAQVVALRDAEAWIDGREGLLDAGATVAAALVPGDEVLAHVDDGHAHHRQAPVDAGDALGFGEHRLAHAAALQHGAHGEHAEI